MKTIPYGKQLIDEEDIQAVIEVLRSDWLTTGPKVDEFEKAFAELVGAKYAVAVSSGTAALHAAMFAIGIKPGDEVIVPPMTFAATVNCVVYQGGTPVFADVDPDTLLIDSKEVEKRINPRTKAIIAVDYAGQPCNYNELLSITTNYKIPLIADSCHALGALYKGRPLGSIADLTVFSFHPVKHITTGEGGMITTNNEEYAKRLRIFRNHGITTDHRQREQQGSWFYEMVELGYNYRITDIQCALGLTQLKKLPHFLKRRWKIAATYNEAFKNLPGIKPLGLRSDILAPDKCISLASFPFNISHFTFPHSPSSPSSSATHSPSSVLHHPSSISSTHAYHLYVVRVQEDIMGRGRDEIFRTLRDAGIGVNVHYIPVHLHPFYRNRVNTQPGLCPVAEKVYKEIISLPMYPGLKDDELEYIIQTIKAL